MCGALVRIWRCSSARLGSGTERKRASTEDSADASRNPKIDVSEGAGARVAGRVDEAGNRRAQERAAVVSSLMGAIIKTITVAHAFRALLLRGQNLHHRVQGGSQRFAQDDCWMPQISRRASQTLSLLLPHLPCPDDLVLR